MDKFCSFVNARCKDVHTGFSCFSNGILIGIFEEFRSILENYQCINWKNTKLFFLRSTAHFFYINSHELFCQFISWTNWVNSGKFMDSCWISCQVMADMKKVFDDLIINNLYRVSSVLRLTNWVLFHPDNFKIWQSIAVSAFLNFSTVPNVMLQFPAIYMALCRLLQSRRNRSPLPDFRRDKTKNLFLQLS